MLGHRRRNLFWVLSGIGLKGIATVSQWVTQGLDWIQDLLHFGPFTSKKVYQPYSFWGLHLALNGDNYMMAETRNIGKRCGSHVSLSHQRYWVLLQPYVNWWKELIVMIYLHIYKTGKEWTTLNVTRIMLKTATENVTKQWQINHQITQ